MSLRELSSASASASASPWRTAAPFPSLPKDQKIRAVCSEESTDDELFTVPDLEASPPSSKATSGSAIQQSSNGVVGDRDGFRGPAKLRKGRNTHDRECRRLKRLLRNRVSAQQARERKKVYVNDLESRANELQDHNAKLEEKIFTLVNENTMLRKVLMNMRPKADEGTDLQNDQSDKS